VTTIRSEPNISETAGDAIQRYISVGISLKELGGQILKGLKFCPGIEI